MLYLAVLTLFLPLAKASELPYWHMKPLGSHIPPDKVDETFADNMISPALFAEKYVVPRIPIVFRGVVKKWPAFRLWTDDYLKENYGDMEMRLEGKKEKTSGIPKGDVCLGRDRLKTFLNDYQIGANKYVVSELPTSMWKDVMVPPPMSCGEFLTNYVEIDVWINSDTGKKGKGGSSLLHKDAFNTVNCVVNGSKDWKLIELKYNDYLYQSWEGPREAGYGGFSLVNPEKIDAKEFPNVGNIPKWKFVTINAGDCLYLPSQTWHQVKSHGATNKAVAFLFSRFDDHDKINTSSCSEELSDVPLSEVDVDLQYPGYGLMTMGDFEISSTQEMLTFLVDKKEGYVTKKRVYRLVAESHEGEARKHILLRKAKQLYAHLLDLAGGADIKMTDEFVSNLTRDQIRVLYKWIYPEEPANSYNHEYSFILPDDILNIIETLMQNNGEKLEREKFIEMYEGIGGTLKFAENLWKKLAGDKNVISDVSNTIEEALHLYEEHRIENSDAEEDEHATIITPQGHVSQPKSRKGAYADRGEVEDESSEDEEDIKDIGNMKIEL